MKLAELSKTTVLIEKIDNPRIYVPAEQMEWRKKIIE